MRGISLIEIMVVLAVFSLMVGMVFGGFRASQSAESTRAVNQIANTIRYGYDKARVDGAYYRLLIDLEGSTFSLQQADGRMYLPATDRDGKPVVFDEREAEAKAERDRRAEESYNRSIQSAAFEGRSGGAEEPVGDEEGAAYNPYTAETRKVPRRQPPLFESFAEENALSGLTKPIMLPPSVKVTYVRTVDDAEPITKGQASLYFFPRGQTQKTHILLEDSERDVKWTIKVAPLTGRVTIDEGHEELELPRDHTDAKDDLGQRFERRTF